MTGDALGEHTKQKVSLFSWLEGTWNNHVASRFKIKPLHDFSSISERAGITGTVMVVHVLFVKLAAIFRSLQMYTHTCVYIMESE